MWLREPYGQAAKELAGGSVPIVGKINPGVWLAYGRAIRDFKVSEDESHFLIYHSAVPHNAVAFTFDGGNDREFEQGDTLLVDISGGAGAIRDGDLVVVRRSLIPMGLEESSIAVAAVADEQLSLVSREDRAELPLTVDANPQTSVVGPIRALIRSYPP